jgi:transcriptional regulator with XRE-family HTH domain
VDIPDLIIGARRASGLSLRDLAARAGTSHSTLSAYESGRVAPSVATLERVLGAAGLAVEIDAPRRIRHNGRMTRDRELRMVLELADSFPAQFADRLESPVFRRIVVSERSERSPGTSCGERTQ